MLNIKNIKFILFISSLATNLYAAGDSTDLSPPRNIQPNTILTLETGHADSSSTEFQTTKICPQNFSPYVVLNINNISTDNAGPLESYKTCPVAIANPSGPYYNIRYEIRGTRGDIQSEVQTDTSATIGGNLYGSNSTVGYTFNTSRPISDLPVTVNDDTVRYQSNVTTALTFTFTWVLYCYPPTQPVPPPLPGCF